MCTSVPDTVKLCTIVPVLVTVSLPFSGAEIDAGVIAYSVSVTCTAPAGAPILRVSACAATAKRQEAEDQRGQRQCDSGTRDCFAIAAFEQGHGSLLCGTAHVLVMVDQR